MDKRIKLIGVIGIVCVIAISSAAFEIGKAQGYANGYVSGENSTGLINKNILSSQESFNIYTLNERILSLIVNLPTENSLMEELTVSQYVNVTAQYLFQYGAVPLGSIGFNYLNTSNGSWYPSYGYKTSVLFEDMGFVLNFSKASAVSYGIEMSSMKAPSPIWMTFQNTSLSDLHSYVENLTIEQETLQSYTA